MSAAENIANAPERAALNGSDAVPLTDKHNARGVMWFGSWSGSGVAIGSYYLLMTRPSRSKRRPLVCKHQGLFDATVAYPGNDVPALEASFQRTTSGPGEGTMTTKRILGQARRGTVSRGTLGSLLRNIRASKGLVQKEVSARLTCYTDPRSIRRIEQGRRPPRDRLLQLAITGLEITDVATINALLAEARYAPLTPKEESEYRLRPLVAATPVPQRVRWMGGHPEEPGILVLSPDCQFIPWSQAKEEIERELLRQEKRIPRGSHVAAHTLQERPNFVIRIVNSQHIEVGSVWFGGDPEKDWAHDGLVRLGVSWDVKKQGPVVWRVMQRYSDGSYRPIKAH